MTCSLLRMKICACSFQFFIPPPPAIPKLSRFESETIYFPKGAVLRVNIFTFVNREETKVEGSHGLHLVGWTYESEQSHSMRGSKRNSGPGLADCVTHFCGNLLTLLRTGPQHPDLSCLSGLTSEKLPSPTATYGGPRWQHM